MAQLVRKTPFEKAKAVDLGPHNRGMWDFSKEGSKYDHNAYIDAIAKTPSELADQIKKENNYYDEKIKTPLDDFKNFEQAVYRGFDPYNQSGRYGIRPYGDIQRVQYPELINAFRKSRGRFASQADDPEIKKYHDEQLAYRNGLYDRVRKIPRDKLDDFAYGYGFFQDPFDYEDEGYVPPKDAEEFLSWMDDVSPMDWEILEDYLNEKGY